MTPHEPRAEQPSAVLGPPRFTLRGLLLATTIAGCLFGTMTALGLYGSLVLLLFLGLGLAHVLGNSLGTRLRDQASQQLGIDAPPRAVRSTPAPPKPNRPSLLAIHKRLSRMTIVMGGCGAVLGGIGGWRILVEIYPDAPSAAMTLGIGSSAVLGAQAGFLLSSFLLVLRQAWREALDEEKISAHRHTR